VESTIVLDGWPYGASRSMTCSKASIEPAATFRMQQASPVIR
jgi:hypothetical protein